MPPTPEGEHRQVVVRKLESCSWKVGVVRVGMCLVCSGTGLCEFFSSQACLGFSSSEKRSCTLCWGSSVQLSHIGCRLVM